MGAQCLKIFESQDSFPHSRRYCKNIIRSASHIQCGSNRVSRADVKQRALCLGHKQLLTEDQLPLTVILLYCANDTALSIAVTLTCQQA